MKTLPSFFHSLRGISLILAFVCLSSVHAKNDVQTRDRITADYTLDTATDLVLTAESDPISADAIIDITHEDAVIILENIRPQQVIDNYANNIRINGAAFSLNYNVQVSVYCNGAMIIPHGTTFRGLTVYTGENYGGSSSNSFTTGTYYKDLGEFNNAIRSFKLKRGYMATFATRSDGMGYSRVFIANDEDIEVPLLQTELDKRISFIRVFRWQWPGKKGLSGGDQTENELLGTSWFYTWGAGENARINREFVPQRHHETGVANGGDQKWGWPGWSEINGRDGTVTHVLGQNEPDNTSGKDEVYTPVDKLVPLHSYFLESGLRVGTFATCNPNGWAQDYVNKCRALNMRVDFVAVHCYLGGQNPRYFVNTQLKSMYDRSGLPVWVTEWNNGANWTGESGWTSDNGQWVSWGSTLAEQRANQARWMAEILPHMEAADWLERYAIYSAVEEKRQMFDWVNGQCILTPAGQVYADHKTTPAYLNSHAFRPTWNHKEPENLQANYTLGNTTITLTWNNENGEMTDSAYVERKIDNGEWGTVAVLPTSETTDGLTWSQRFTDRPITGTHYYRIRNFDCDGHTRLSGEASVTIGGAIGNAGFQYGRINIANSETNTVYVDALDNKAPAVFFSFPTANNTGITTVPFLYTRTSKLFTMALLPWQKPAGTATELSQEESVDFFAITPGIYTFGDMTMQVAQISGSISPDGTEVTFAEPFPDGVTPIVFVQPYERAAKTPYWAKVKDVTPTGFTAVLERQAGETGSFTAKPGYYIAVTPGHARLSDGRVLSAGLGQKNITGTANIGIAFDLPTPEQRGLKNPYLLLGAQTQNLPVTSQMRLFKLQEKSYTTGTETYKGVYGATVRRMKDASDPTASSSSIGDVLGWMAVSEDPDTTSTDIGTVPFPEDQISIEVSDRCIRIVCDTPVQIYASDGARVMPDTPLQPGIYLVRHGHTSHKVVVP